MGFISRLLGLDQVPSYPFDTYDPAQRVLADPYEPWRGAPGGFGVADPGVPLPELYRAGVEAIWRSQPNVRKVVDFCARNIAGIPLHAYERVSDTDRQRVHAHEHVLASTLASPQPRVSPFRFWHSVLSDGLLYDRWAAIIQPLEDGRLSLVQVPSWRLRFDVDALRRVAAAWFWVGDQRPAEGDRAGWRPLDLSMLIFDHGYAPKAAGLSPLETLADILAESAEAVTYRRQVWKNGARVPAWIERPAEAKWEPATKERFVSSFRAAYSGDGPQAGGVPLLEDGMKLHALEAFTPQDSMDLEGRRLTAIECAAAWHIAPELVGAQQGNYSNVKEFRQMLYRDSLGPYISAWEGALNAQLVPEVAPGRRLYVEANVESKLRGSFEEQATVKQSATGAPWLTRNEARALENRPPVDGGDELVVPLNVLVGGQASPRDGVTAGGGGGAATMPADDIAKRVAAATALIRSGFEPAAALEAVGLDPIDHLGLLPVTVQSQDDEPAAEPKARRTGALTLKARVADTYQAKAEEVLAAFFDRQGRVMAALAGAGGVTWDEDRWNRELSDDLYALNALIATQAGKTALTQLGMDPTTWDEGRTLAWLRANADGVATGVNGRTRVEVESAAAQDEPVDAVKALYSGTVAARAGQIATTQVTAISGFGTTEAANQAGLTAVKTWRTRAGKSRHSRLDGETVPVGETFSNGARWPGDSTLDDDDRAGCRCELDVTVEA